MNCTLLTGFSHLFVEIYNPGAPDMVDVPPPVPMIVPPPIPPPAAPPFDELLQQSQWNLQQQEQHLHTLRQVQKANVYINAAHNDIKLPVKISVGVVSIC